MLQLAQVSSTSSDPAFALALAIIVALVYLLVLRLADPNEREPVWAMALLLVLGAVGALVLSTLVDEKTLDGTVVEASIAIAVTLFIAIAIGLGLLEAIGQLRGWSELNGMVDGIIYGAAAGLGFAVGGAFISQLNVNDVLDNVLEPSPLDTLWPILLAGLAAGLFGALIGAGFGAAVDRSGGAARLGLPLGGLLLAFAVQCGYLALAHDNVLAGSDARARHWIALAIPALFFIALLVTGLRRERRTISDELSGDPAVTPEELTLLTNPVARRAAYMRHLAALDFDGWLALRSLQNRQVQLALTERRLARARSSGAGDDLAVEVERLRAAVDAARRQLAARSDVGTPARAET